MSKNISKQTLKKNVVLINTDKLLEEYVLKYVSKLKSAVVFYFPHESLQMEEVLKVVEVSEDESLISDNRLVVLNTSKFSRDELSILSYNISRLKLFDIVEVFENGQAIDKDLFKRKTQSIPYDESPSFVMSDQDFYKLIDELAKSNPKTAKITRKNYLVSR